MIDIHSFTMKKQTCFKSCVFSCTRKTILTLAPNKLPNFQNTGINFATHIKLQNMIGFPNQHPKTQHFVFFFICLRKLNLTNRIPPKYKGLTLFDPFPELVLHQSNVCAKVSPCSSFCAYMSAGSLILIMPKYVSVSQWANRTQNFHFQTHTNFPYACIQIRQGANLPASQIFPSTAHGNPNSEQQSRWPQLYDDGGGKLKWVFLHMCPRVRRNFLIYFLASVQGSSCFVCFTFQVRQNKLLMEIHAFGIIDFSAGASEAGWKLSPSGTPLTFELYKFDMNGTINGQGRCSIWQLKRGAPKLLKHLSMFGFGICFKLELVFNG